MFTGIIRHLGTVTNLITKKDGTYLTIKTSLAKNVVEGDSVAVNGTCLTVLEHTSESIDFRLMQETLDKTSLGQATKESVLNLERPVGAGEYFDGHFVLGHVDGVAEITDISAAGDDRIFTLKPAVDILRYFIPKGSVSLDGISLTVVDVTADSFTVSMMPYTLERTNFGSVEVGYRANVEIDMIAKHVERLVAAR
jgi:riboflavin synthase